jgi:nucleoside-diphosphate-sugar epimerase
MVLRVLVIGGTGAFGRRLISGLIATTDHDVVIAVQPGYIISTWPMQEILLPASRGSTMTRKRQE